MSIISLSQAIEKRNAPDADCTSIDLDGNTAYRFGLSYSLGGVEHTFAIWAKDAEDAERHAASIRASAGVYGQIVSEGAV